jgi:flavin-dependent dehydrogenase
MLAAAQRVGAVAWQPWRVKSYRRSGESFECCIERKWPYEKKYLSAPVVIAAHGSWDSGRIAPAWPRRRAAASDLFAFKAHFKGGALEPSRMPLVAFRGGYGGLVTSDSGRTSFSCCIRRDVLAECRTEMSRVSAGAAVLTHVFGACRGMRDAVGSATRDEAWLAVGPLQPGIRSLCGQGYFAVGNAIGEAHPIVAEGISMAIQSAWLLCERLIGARRTARSPDWDAIGQEYESDYRRNFERRIAASSAFALLAMRQSTAGVVAGLLGNVPGLLSLGARWAGKTTPLYESA